MLCTTLSVSSFDTDNFLADNTHNIIPYEFRSHYGRYNIIDTSAYKSPDDYYRSVYGIEFTPIEIDGIVYYINNETEITTDMINTIKMETQDKIDVTLKSEVTANEYNYTFDTGIIDEYNKQMRNYVDYLIKESEYVDSIEINGIMYSVLKFNEDIYLLDEINGKISIFDGELKDLNDMAQSVSNSCDYGSCIYIGCGYVTCLNNCGNWTWRPCLPIDLRVTVIGNSNVCYTKAIFCPMCLDQVSSTTTYSHEYSSGRCGCTVCGFSGQGANHALIPNTYIVGYPSACFETLGVCNRCSYFQINYVESTHSWEFRTNDYYCRRCNIRATF